MLYKLEGERRAGNRKKNVHLFLFAPHASLLRVLCILYTLSARMCERACAQVVLLTPGKFSTLPPSEPSVGGTFSGGRNAFVRVPRLRGLAAHMNRKERGHSNVKESSAWG